MERTKEKDRGREWVGKRREWRVFASSLPLQTIIIFISSTIHLTFT